MKGPILTDRLATDMYVCQATWYPNGEEPVTGLILRVARGKEEIFVTLTKEEAEDLAMRIMKNSMEVWPEFFDMTALTKRLGH